MDSGPQRETLNSGIWHVQRILACSLTGRSIGQEFGFGFEPSEHQWMRLNTALDSISYLLRYPQCWRRPCPQSGSTH